MPYDERNYRMSKRLAAAMRAAAEAKPKSWSDPITGLKFPHVYIDNDNDKTTTASPEVNTPATTETTATPEGHKEAFEVKVFGYGTNSPTFSITAPSEAPNNSKEGPNKPVKIIASVEHNGQEHEICSTFNTLKISNVANEETANANDGDAVAGAEHTCSIEMGCNDWNGCTVEREEPEWIGWGNFDGTQEKEHFTSLDKVAALLMQSEKQMKDLYTLAALQVAEGRTTGHQELFNKASVLSASLKRVQSIAEDRSVFSGVSGYRKEHLKEDALLELESEW